MSQNICFFIPFHQNVHPLHTINYVYETLPQHYDHLKSESVYKVYFVYSGEGLLHITGKTFPLKRGDVFFTFPATPFAIESIENFTYMYISFVGSRGNMIMENLKINPSGFLFHDLDEISDFWQRGFSVKPELIDLISESVLLYTFSVLGNRLLPEKASPKQTNCIDLIKKYIDEHFTDIDFSLDKMSNELSYHKKYISHVFKANIGITISQYISTIRIQNACTMIEQGYTSINDIAGKCGFSDAQYFSKVFKEKMGISPTHYMKSMR